MAKLDIVNAKVALLSGGWSDEREISLLSGQAVYKALIEAGFKDVDVIDMADPDSVSKLQNNGYDVAFIAMHGQYGEDGCVQGLLETLKIPYTFSGVTSSALSSDKEISKLMYRQAGIPVADPDYVYHGGAVDVDYLKEAIGFPMFIKPAANGSSYGVTRVTEESQIIPALEEACAGGSKALVEPAQIGIEITVPVIGKDNPQALPVVEINTGSDFYDSQVKYEPSELHHIIPARLDETVYKEAQRLAVEAHKALMCSGASRSDFIVKEDGTVVILETNSIPGMTENSLLPDSARYAGISFSQLVTKFIELALNKSN